MSADILERLERETASRVSCDVRQTPEIFRFRHDEDVRELLREAAAEIGRLRGEVEALRQCGVKYLGWLGVKDAENGLRKDMADPEMVERPAPAMPNGVEGLVQNFLDKEVHPTVRDWENRNLAGISILKHWRDFLISLTHAADNRDAAGVDRMQEVAHDDSWLPKGCITINDYIAECEKDPEMKAALDAVRARRPRRPRRTPTAVPAGEAVASGSDGWTVIEAALARAVKADPADAPFGTTPAEASVWHAAQASAYQHALEMIERTTQPADGEAVATVCAAARARFGPAAHPHAVADWIEEQFRATLPAAPVQASPQEGEAIVQVIAYRPLEGTATVAWEGERDPSWMRLGARFYAHHSACELGAVREVIDRRKAEAEKRSRADDGYTMGWSDGVAGFAQELEAALQHRGDSRGGEG